jgi:hypothetical protein
MPAYTHKHTHTHTHIFISCMKTHRQTKHTQVYKNSDTQTSAAHRGTCTHSYTCIHAHRHTFINMNPGTQAHTHIHADMHTLIYMHTGTHAHMHTCSHAHTHAHRHLAVHTDKYTATCSNTKTYTRAHTFPTAAASLVFNFLLSVLMFGAFIAGLSSGKPPSSELPPLLC